MKPGIYPAMPAADYHAINAVSASILKRLHESSPAHVKADPFTPTAAMDNGSALHCLVLEPQHFEARFYSRPKVDGRTKAGKEAIAQASVENEGKTGIAADDMESIRLAGAAIQAHPFVAPLLSDSKREVSLIWEDAEIGTLCKARLDLLAGTTIGDLKTTRNAHPSFFTREIRFERAYWLQGAWYYRGARALGLTIEEFTFIAIELFRPFGVTLHTMDEPELISIQPKIVPLAEQWAECTRTGVYPAYAPMKHYITVGG